MKPKPPRRTVYDMIHESVPRRTRGGLDRRLATICKRVAAKIKRRRKGTK